MKAFVVAGLLAAALSMPQGAAAEQPPPRAAEVKAAQPIPFRQDNGAGAMALDVGLGLVVALAAGLGVLYLLRRYLAGVQRAPGRRLRLIETVRLGPKSALFLVELDGRGLLIGQQGDSLAVLERPPLPPGASTPAEPPAASDDAG